MILLRILMKIHIWWIYSLNINYGSNQPLFFFSIYASKGFLGLLALRISVYIRILTPNKKGLQGATHIIRISLSKRKTKNIKSYQFTMLLKVIFTMNCQISVHFSYMYKSIIWGGLTRLSNLKRIRKHRFQVFFPGKGLWYNDTTYYQNKIITWLFELWNVLEII